MTIAKTARKIAGVILAVVLVLSVCSVSFAAIPTTDTDTLAALGIVGGTANLANSPDGSGEKVIQYTGTNSRPNVQLADNDWVEGRVYTIRLMYWLGADNTGGGFRGYYGVDPTSSGGRTEMVNKDTAVNNSYKGDGQWHEFKYTFTYNPPADKPSQTHVFMSFFAIGKFNIYIKDIEVFTRDDITGDMSHMIDENGEAKKVVNNDFFYGSNGAINQAYVGDDGVYVIKPSGGSTASTGRAGYQYLKPQINYGTSVEKVVLEPGYTYSVTLTYKVVKLDANNKANIGIGYLVNGNTETSVGISGSSWYKTYVRGSIGVTNAVSENYTTFNCTFDYPDETTADLVIVPMYAGAEIAIKEYHIVRRRTDDADTSIVTYNDNGVITTALARVGDPTMDGKNGYLGEECKGWYDNTQFTGDAVTTVPTGDPTLYAKYNTVVIEHFNMLYGMRNNYDKYSTNIASVVRGDGIKLNTTTVGFMIPAYDEYGNNDTVDGYYDWYNFEIGKKYSIIIEAKNASATITDASKNNKNNLYVTSASAAGDGGARDQKSQFVIQNISSEDAPIDKLVVGAAFEWKAGEKSFNHAIIRGGAEGVTMGMLISKIIITEVTDEPVAALTMQSIRQASESEGISAGIRFRARVSAATLANANEAGFVIVPDKALNGKTVAEYMAEDGSMAVTGVNYVKGQKDVLYDQVGGDALKNNDSSITPAFYDYQVVLTGLNEQMHSLDLTVAFYTKGADGNATYLDEYTTSYDAVLALMQ